MKRVLKTLILLTILGAIAAFAWKRWQSRGPGPLWREEEQSWPAAPGPAAGATDETGTETIAEPAIEAAPEEPAPAPVLPAVVATAPLVADADFREMLAEDELLESIQPAVAEPGEDEPLPPLPDWATPPLATEPEPALQFAPVEEPAYLAAPPVPVELAAPEVEVAPAVRAPAVPQPAPGERWYWPWQRPRPESTAPGAEAQPELAEPIVPSAPVPAMELPPEPEVEAVESTVAPEPEPGAEIPVEEAAVEQPRDGIEPLAVAPDVEPGVLAEAAPAVEETLPPFAAEAAAPAEHVEQVEMEPAPGAEELAPPPAEAVAPEVEPWPEEPAARDEGGFRWPWQREDAGGPVTTTPDLEQLADQLDGVDEAFEEEESPPPAPPAPPEPAARESGGGFRWPWQKRKEEEPPAPAAETVEQVEFEDTGLSWGITPEDETVAAEWLETAPEGPAEPAIPVAAFEPPTAPEPPPAFEVQAAAPVQPPPPPAPSFIPGAPLTSALEEALEQVRPEPVAQYAGRSAESFLDEGNVYFNVGQYGLAIERYSRALELDPNLTAGYYNRANARTRAGEYDLALDDYNSALELEPNDADALNNRGMLHLYRAGYGAALRDFNAALQIDPTDTTVIVNRGLAQLHGGDPAAALVDFQEAAALDDMDAAAHYGAAQAASALGNREESLRRLRRALQIDPAYAREAAADAKLVPLQGDTEFMRILREAGGRR